MASIKRTFTIPDDISMKLDEAIPSKQRSKFIAVTLREALKERKRNELLELLGNIEPEKNPTGIASEDLLRDIRARRSQEIISNS